MGLPPQTLLSFFIKKETKKVDGGCAGIQAILPFTCQASGVQKQVRYAIPYRCGRLSRPSPAGVCQKK